MIRGNIYPHFVPAAAQSLEQTEPGWWFVFHNNKLLVEQKGDSVAIPCVINLSELNLTPIRKQYLGILDGRHCYSAELAEDVTYPEGLSLQGLRQLYGVLREDIFWVAGRAFQIMKWDQTHQFCGRCGNHTQDKNNEYAKICPNCGFTNYPQMAPAIIVAVVKENQILLAKAVRFKRDFYSVLAGFVEPGESLEECVRREVQEEVGLEVKNINYFSSQPWPFPNSLMVAFTAEYANGKITIDEAEIVDAGWYTVDNLPNIPDKISISRRLIDWFIENQE